MKKMTDVEKKMNKNYAEQYDYAEIVAKNLLDMWQELRSQRHQREKIWQDSYRAWSVDRTETDKNYDGMADLNVPQLRKEVETMSRRLFKGMLGDDYLKAEAIEIADDDLAILNSQLVRHYYDNIIKIKGPALPWIKQCVLYGTSAMRQSWKKETNDMFYKKREPYLDKGEIKFINKVVNEPVTVYNAPILRATDMFETWVYPHSAQTPDDIEAHFYRTKVKKSFLKQKYEMGQCARFEDLKDHGKSRDWDFEESQERLQQFGASGMLISSDPDDGYYDFLEIWIKMPLPDCSTQSWVVVEIVDEKICTRIQRNPFWHQMAPFDYARFIIPPVGEFYGRGLPEAAISLQHQLNDTMNQTMDSATLALNNITIINPAYAPNAESFELEPNAVWWADPNAVKQFAFPDLSKTGYAAAGSLRQMITELSDNQPQLPDPIAGKARSTGQAQLAVNEWQTDLYTIIDQICTEALSNIAYKTHSLIQQNITEDEVIRISGKYAGTWMSRVVTPHEIVGRYVFTWVPSLQIENQAIKTQQMLNFPKVWSMLPPEEKEKINLNWENWMIKLFRDGFMIKDVHNIVQTKNVNASINPEIENKICHKGGTIKVQDSDDDNQHMISHQAYLKTLDPKKDAFEIIRISQHMAKHQQSVEEKQVKAQMMALQMQAMQAQGQGAGNPTDIPQSTSQANIERGMKIETT